MERRFRGEKNSSMILEEEDGGNLLSRLLVLPPVGYSITHRTTSFTGLWNMSNQDGWPRNVGTNVLQSKANSRGDVGVLWERIRSDILRASNYPSFSFLRKHQHHHHHHHQYPPTLPHNYHWLRMNVKVLQCEQPNKSLVVTWQGNVERYYDDDDDDDDEDDDEKEEDEGRPRREEEEEGEGGKGGKATSFYHLCIQGLTIPFLNSSLPRSLPPPFELPGEKFGLASYETRRRSGDEACSESFHLDEETGVADSMLLRYPLAFNYFQKTNHHRTNNFQLLWASTTSAASTLSETLKRSEIVH
ncbi:hypothetical protein M0802_006554 [Mischocyttarus mexicanus]|nr:hypothetical protein M0802_006554 [Mischocyttarus mexicanus]